MTEYMRIMLETLQINQLIEELSSDYPLENRQELAIRYLEKIVQPQKLSDNAVTLFFSGLPRKVEIFANHIILESDMGDIAITFYVDDPSFDYSKYSGIAEVRENREEIILYDSLNGKTVKLNNLSIIYLNERAKN